MLSPDDEPYYGDMDLFTWDMWQEQVINTVSLRQRAGFRHVSSSMFHSFAAFPIDLAIAGLYGCTSLVGETCLDVAFWGGSIF